MLRGRAFLVYLIVLVSTACGTRVHRPMIAVAPATVEQADLAALLVIPTEFEAHADEVHHNWEHRYEFGPSATEGVVAIVEEAISSVEVRRGEGQGAQMLALGRTGADADVVMIPRLETELTTEIGSLHIDVAIHLDVVDMRSDSTRTLTGEGRGSAHYELGSSYGNSGEEALQKALDGLQERLMAWVLEMEFGR